MKTASQTAPPGVMMRRRDLLQGGAAVGAASLACSLGAVHLVRAAEATLVGSSCLTILYLDNDNGDTFFDYDYYRDYHLPLIMTLYGQGIERFELRRPVLREGDVVPDWAAVANIWIRDTEVFAAASQQHGADVVADVSNFTNARLVAQAETVLAEAFSQLQATTVGENCHCLAYPREPGATWDAGYYRDTHLPLLMALYGSEAVRRVEVRQGPSNGDFLATVNIYVEDPAAFDAATAMHRDTLNADLGNFSSVLPVVLVSEIYAIGTNSQ